MSLPASIHRCPGMPTPQAWPFPGQQPDCLMECARRRQGIADYMAGVPVLWMQPPKETPCAEILRPKEKRNA